MSSKSRYWIFRDYLACSGCRVCEVVCSMLHEGIPYPEASRIRVFEFYPGINVPHTCVQCSDYPCVKSCPSKALSVDEVTGAVIVDADACSGCGKCVDACPGKVPRIHPVKKYALICDLCGGDPACVKVCRELGFNALAYMERGRGGAADTYAREPWEIAKDLCRKVYGIDLKL